MSRPPTWPPGITCASWKTMPTPTTSGNPCGATGDARTFTATYHVAHATYLKIVAAAKKAGLPASSPCQKTF